MVCSRIEVENHTQYTTCKGNKRNRTTNSGFTYNKKIWMQSYQIQVKAFEGNIPQYQNHIQDIEKAWIEHPGM